MAANEVPNRSIRNVLERFSYGLLIFIVVGVPPLLLTRVGLHKLNPDIDWGALRNRLLAGDVPVELITAVFMWIIAAVWASITIGIIVEVIAALGSAQAPNLMVIPGTQFIARRLVAGLLLTVTGLTATVTPAMAKVAPAAATVVNTNVTAAPVASAATPRVATTVIDVTTPNLHTVQPDETLRSLAQHHLGDANRWKEIRTANLDTIAPNAVSLTVGAQIVLPTADRLNQPATPAADVDASTVIVEEGDNLWTLTEETLQGELGQEPTDAQTLDRWKDVIEANPQFDNPDLIYPGDTVQGLSAQTDTSIAAPPEGLAAALPGRAPTAQPETVEAPEVEARAAENASRAVTEERARPAAEPDTVTSTAADAPTASAAAKVQQVVGADAGESELAASTEASSVDAAEVIETTDAKLPAVIDLVEPAGPENDADELLVTSQLDYTRVAVALLTLPLLGFGLRSLSNAVRRRQAGLRPAGKIIPHLSPDAAVVEAALPIADSETTDADRLAVVMRAVLAAVPAPAPAILGALLTSEGVRIQWETGTNPKPKLDSFQSLEGDVWFADTSPDAFAVLKGLAGGPAAAPALVTAGFAGDKQLFLNLEALSRLDVRGEPDEVFTTMHRIALELAMSPLVGESVIIGLGLTAELPGLSYRPADSLGDVIEHIESEAERIATAVESSSVLDERRSELIRDDILPLVVIDNSQASPQLRARLAAAADRSGGGVCVVSGYDTDSVWALELAGNEILITGDMNTNLRAPEISLEALEAIQAYLTEVSSPTYADAPKGTLIEGEICPKEPYPLTEPANELTAAEIHQPEASIMVQTLGNVSATGATLQPRPLELVAYMLANGGTASSAQIHEAMYEDSDNPQRAITKLIIRTREALGHTTDDKGNEALRLSHVDPATGAYRLHDVTSDVNEMIRIKDQINSDDGTGDLADQAQLLDGVAQLINGLPYSGKGTAYSWAIKAGHHTAALTIADDLCRELAQAYMILGYHDRAEWAARQGLKACPECAHLYEILLRAAGEAGETHRRESIWQEILTVFDDEVPAVLVAAFENPAYAKISKAG